MTREARAPFMRREVPIDVEAIKAGEGAAFRQMYEGYQSAVLATAYAILNDWGKAQDTCQDVFLKVLQNVGRFQAGTNFKAWILSITHNTAIDGLRRGRREVEMTADVVAVELDLDARKAFTDLLAPLDEDERIVVTLKYLEDLPYHDIAGITGKAEGTLRNLLSRALKKLRGLLMPPGGPP